MQVSREGPNILSGKRRTLGKDPDFSQVPVEPRLHGRLCSHRTSYLTSQRVLGWLENRFMPIGEVHVTTLPVLFG